MLVAEKTAEEWKQDGNILFKTANYLAAVEAYSQAILLNPTESTFLGNRAAAYLQSNQFELALQDCIQATKLDPTMTKAYFRAAKCQVSLGNLDDAITQINSAQALPSGISNHKATVKKEIQEIKSLSSKLNEYHRATAKLDYNLALRLIEEAMIMVDKSLLGSGLPKCTSLFNFSFV